MKLEQAARQALEALIEANVVSERYQNAEKREQAITALQEALAKQAEQEPVAWALSHSMGLEFGSKYPIQETKEAAEQMARQHMGAVVVTPLYAAPVRTKDPCNPLQDLTDDEIAEACGWKFGQPMYELVIGLSRAVIAADREKNK